MDNMNLENAIAVAGTVGAIVAVIIRAIVKSEKLMQAEPEDDSMLGQSLDVTATQTEMMRRLMDRVDENEKTIATMNHTSTRFRDAQCRTRNLQESAGRTD